MASQNRYKSEQAVETPSIFFAAVERKFGKFDIDLAATPDNAKVLHNYITPQQNTFNQPWFLNGRGWLNPEYGDLEDYANKCAYESDRGCQIIELIPASISTSWFRDCCVTRAAVVAIEPRITFIGHKHPYPKDLMLLLYNIGNYEPGTITCWSWL